jgi:hypothetical protein
LKKGKMATGSAARASPFPQSRLISGYPKLFLASNPSASHAGHKSLQGFRKLAHGLDSRSPGPVLVHAMTITALRASWQLLIFLFGISMLSYGGIFVGWLATWHITQTFCIL